MIRDVFCDVDDTLLDFHWAERRALSGTLRHFGLEPCEEVLARYHDINRRQWERLERGEITREEVKTGRFRLLFAELGADIDPVQATRCYESRLAVGHRFMEGAPELLDALDGAYRLYLVTNGTAGAQRGRLESAGLLSRVQGLFISQEVGYEKPDVRFFERCFAAVPDFSRETAVMVGDSLTSDIRGGRGAGLTTVWFAPAGNTPPADNRPDYTITRLSQLPPLLARL